MRDLILQLSKSSIYSTKPYDDDEPIGGVTHWMPLPEPPRLKEL
nr:DUF551 domain-containing protein [Escherichia coli]